MWNKVEKKLIKAKVFNWFVKFETNFYSLKTKNKIFKILFNYFIYIFLDK